MTYLQDKTKSVLIWLGTILQKDGYVPELDFSPEQKLAKLKEWGFVPFSDPHQPDCPRNLSSGYLCNCVPPAIMWTAPKEIQVFMKDTWEDRRKRATGKTD